MAGCRDLLPPDKELINRESTWQSYFNKFTKDPSSEILDWDQSFDNVSSEMDRSNDSASASTSDPNFVDTDGEEDTGLVELAAEAKALAIDRAASWPSKGVIIKMQSRPFTENFDSWLLKNSLSYRQEESRRDLQEKEEYSIVTQTISDKNSKLNKKITTETFSRVRIQSSVSFKTSGSSEITVEDRPSLSMFDLNTKPRSRNRQREERFHRRHRNSRSSSSSGAECHLRRVLPQLKPAGTITKDISKKLMPSQRTATGDSNKYVPKKDAQPPLHISSSDSDVFIGPKPKPAEITRLQNTDLNQVPIGKYKKTVMKLAGNGKTFDQPQIKDNAKKEKINNSHSERSKRNKLPIQMLQKCSDTNENTILKDLDVRQAIINDEKTNRCKTDTVAETEKSTHSIAASSDSSQQTLETTAIPKKLSSKHRKKMESSQSTGSSSKSLQNSKRLEKSIDKNEKHKTNCQDSIAVHPRSISARSAKGEKALQFTSSSSGTLQNTTEITARNEQSHRSTASSSDSLQQPTKMPKKSKKKENSQSTVSPSKSQQNSNSFQNKMFEIENHKENVRTIVDPVDLHQRSTSTSSFEPVTRSKPHKLTSASSGSLQKNSETAAMLKKFNPSTTTSSKNRKVQEISTSSSSSSPKKSQDHPSLIRQEADHQFKKPMVPVKRKHLKKPKSILSANGANISSSISNGSHGLKKLAAEFGALQINGGKSSVENDMSSSSISKSKKCACQPNTSSKSNNSSVMSNTLSSNGDDTSLKASGSARISVVIFSPQKYAQSLNLSSNVSSHILLSIREIAKIAKLEDSRCLKFLGKNVKIDDTIKLDSRYRYTFEYPEHGDDSTDSDSDDLDAGLKNRGSIIQRETFTLGQT